MTNPTIIDTTESIYINEAKMSQVKTIAECWQAIDDLVEAKPFSADKENKTQRARDILSHAISSPTARVLVAEDENSIVGTITGHLYQRPTDTHASMGVIYSLWVAPAQRQQGIGQALLDSIEQQLSLLGAEAFQVGWDTGNHYAAQWWQKRGYAAYETIASKTINHT